MSQRFISNVILYRPNKMNILILNWRDIKHDWAGGGEVYIFELAKRWAKMGHQVILFCGQNVGKRLPLEEKIDGIFVYRRGGKYSLYLWAAWYYLTRFRKSCDVIIDVQNGTPFFSVLYSRKPKVSIVYHVHGRQFFIELPFPINIVGFLIERFLFPLFYFRTPMMVISETTKREITHLGFPKKNIHIVHCGINGNNRRYGSSIKKFVQPTILYLGRIKRYKRVDLLVKIMPAILASIPKARLLIVGWGTEASAITDMSMRSVTKRRIKIVGPVSESEKKRLLSKAWVFVNPSIGEGWGISVIEANLHGTPAISFDVSGLSESIQDGKTGLLAHNEQDLINKICAVLTDEKLRMKLSKNAKGWAERFSWDEAAAKSIRIIQNLRD